MVKSLVQRLIGGLVNRHFFNQRGVGRTTVRHITTPLAIGLGHFNHYFRKKEDLIHALYLSWVGELQARVVPFTTGTGEVHFLSLLQSVQQATRLVCRYKFLVLDWAYIVRTIPAVQRHFEQVLAQRRQHLLALLTQLTVEGFFRPLPDEQHLRMLVDATFIIEGFWILRAENFAEGKTEDQIVRYFTQLYCTVIGLGLTEKGLAALQQAFAQLPALDETSVAADAAPLVGPVPEQ